MAQQQNDNVMRRYVPYFTRRLRKDGLESIIKHPDPSYASWKRFGFMGLDWIPVGLLQAITWFWEFGEQDGIHRRSGESGFPRIVY